MPQARSPHQRVTPQITRAAKGSSTIPSRSRSRTPTSADKHPKHQVSGGPALAAMLGAKKVSSFCLPCGFSQVIQVALRSEGPCFAPLRIFLMTSSRLASLGTPSTGTTSGQQFTPRVRSSSVPVVSDRPAQRHACARFASPLRQSPSRQARAQIRDVPAEIRRHRPTMSAPAHDLPAGVATTSTGACSVPPKGFAACQGKP